MKSLYILVVIFAVAVVADKTANDEKIERIRNYCLKKHKVDPDVLAKFEKDGIMPNDRKMKCLAFCFWYEEGYLLPNGKVNLDFSFTHPPFGDDASKLRDAVIRCKDIPEVSDPCENLARVHRCYFQHRTELKGTWQTY